MPDLEQNEFHTYQRSRISKETIKIPRENMGKRVIILKQEKDFLKKV